MNEILKKNFSIESTSILTKNNLKENFFILYIYKIILYVSLLVFIDLLQVTNLFELFNVHEKNSSQH